LPVIVLVDAGSASASEIVAGALQDQHRGLVMGERSFGKGSVQTMLPLSNTSALKLTTARYYTPSGRSVQEGGIQPDIRVPQLSDPDYKNRPKYRESDLRRHLINEIKSDDKALQHVGRGTEKAGHRGFPARLCAQDDRPPRQHAGRDHRAGPGGGAQAGGEVTPPQVQHDERCGCV
jgi:C-terminal processing protease CtpA/Prc